MQTCLTTAPLDPAQVIAAIHATGRGATALFLGTVRDQNDGRSVLELEYSAYESMALRELERITTEAAARFGETAVIVQHRLGTLQVGDTSVIVAAAHQHRADALDACRYVIEELKRRVPIWKRERYADGSSEWVDPTRALEQPLSSTAR